MAINQDLEVLVCAIVVGICSKGVYRSYDILDCDPPVATRDPDA